MLVLCFNVIPKVTKDVVLPTGHILPEGTIAMTNISRFSITLASYAAKIYFILFARFMSDPLLWDSPDQFNPERQGKEYSQNLDASACSMLKNSCPGF